MPPWIFADPYRFPGFGPLIECFEKIKNLRSGRARSEDSPNALLKEGRTILFRDDASSEDDDVGHSRFTQTGT